MNVVATLLTVILKDIVMPVSLTEEPVDMVLLKLNALNAPNVER